jgi:hypothetical protein
VLDLLSSQLLATSGAQCRLTTAPAYFSHRRPISLDHRLQVSLSAIAAFVPLPVSSSHRLPSSPPLIPAIKQFVPIPFKVLHPCIPISTRTDSVVSQLPLLQISVQASWAHSVLLLPIAFNPLAVSGQRVLSCFLPEHSPRSHPPQLSPTLACGLPHVTLRTPPRLISPNFRF